MWKPKASQAHAVRIDSIDTMGRLSKTGIISPLSSKGFVNCVNFKWEIKSDMFYSSYFSDLLNAPDYYKLGFAFR